MRTLSKKLGIKKGFRIAILNPPKNFKEKLGRLPNDVPVVNTLKGPLDLIHLFSKSKEELEIKFPNLKQVLSENGALWVSWPKSSSKVDTDLN